MEIDGKCVVITGASSGFGLEVMRKLSHRDVDIIAVARNEERLMKAIRDIPAKCRIIPLAVDVSTPEGVDAIFNIARDECGGIDIFIASAGFGYYEALKDARAEWEHVDSIYRTNVISPIHSLHRLLSQGREFTFVFIASGLSFIPYPGFSLYTSTKAALRMFFRSFEFERPEWAHVMIVYPVAAHTGFFKSAGEDVPVPMMRQSPERVADAIIRGIERNKREVYPHWPLRLSLMADRIFPFLIRSYLWYEKKRFEDWLRKRKRNP